MVVRSVLLALGLGVGLGLAVIASGGGARAEPKAERAPRKDVVEKSLYERLGGVDAIEVLVHDLLANAAADQRLGTRFAKVDLRKLEKQIVEQVCAATGGPCKYKGRGMAEAHRGMKITEAELAWFLEHLVKVLDKYKVLAREKRDLLGLLGGMKGDVVGK